MELHNVAVADRYRLCIIIIIIIILWVWHIFAHECQIFAPRAMACACALNLDVAIGWVASGVILDFMVLQGVSCTKVLHSFDEAQILIWSFVCTNV